MIKIPVFVAYVAVATGSSFFAGGVFRRDLLADPPELRAWATTTKFALLCFMALSLTGFVGILLIAVFDSFTPLIWGVLLEAFLLFTVGTTLCLHSLFVPGTTRAARQHSRIASSRLFWGRDYVTGPLAGIDGLFRYERPGRPRRRREGRKRPTA